MPLSPIARLSSRFLLALAILAGAADAFAAPLAFDATFGTGGQVTTAIARATSDEEARAVAFQSDGKTVVAGVCGGPTLYFPGEICVARYTNAGALDITFGDRGIFRTSPAVGTASIRAVTLDGTKIVVAGHCGADAAQDFCVLRLNANGTLDTTFNTTGMAVTPVGSLGDYAYAVAMDGTKIVVAGECEVSGSTDMCLVRYNADGSLDGTFGNGGIALHALSTISDGAYALAVIGGQVYAGGRCGSAPISFCVIRLTAAGALDTTWAGNGKLYANVGTGQSRVTALAASGSRLLAAGECSNGSNTDFCLLRIDSTGQPDTTLNGNGILIRPMGTGEDLLTGLTLVGSSTFLSGNCDSGGKKVFCLVHITETGGISGSFNGGSVLLDPIGSTNAIATGLAPGFSTLTMAGTCGTQFTFRDWCFTRYSLFGQRDASLNTTGLVVNDLRVSGGNDLPQSLLRQPDGKLLVAGTCSGDGGANYTRCLARYLANGTLDTAFGTGGVAEAFVGGQAYDAALALDADGRIYAAGSCVNATLFCVTRFLANGLIDFSYGTSGTVSAPAGTDVTIYGIKGAVVDATGAVVIGGFCYVPPGINDFCAAKFTPAGALDGTFGSSGRVIVSVASTDNAASFIADGTGFLISGDCFPGGASEFCVVRLTAAGQPDPAFGGGTGKVSFPIGAGSAFRPAAALTTGGKIWLAGTCPIAGVNQFCIARLLADGTLDTSFSTDGKASAPVLGLDDNGIALLPDGTGLLVAGSCRRPGPVFVYDFCLARFLADGTLDPAFNDSGVFSAHFGSDFNFNNGRGLLRDGNRVVALVDGSGFTLAGFALLANDVPRAPTGVVGTPGDGQVSVAFTPPTDNGGNTILSYEATCGTQSQSGTGSPLVVIGLTNGFAVTCTVTATNSAGTGPASAASASVTPRKPTTVAVSSSANPANAGATIFLTATVTGEGPGGTVVIKDGGVTINNCGGMTVTAGEASCFVNNLTVGAHNLTAEYAGDAANLPSTSPTFVQTIITSGFTLVAGPAGGSPGVGNGRVTSSPTGIDCGTSTSNCQASFANGTQVTLTAIPDAGHRFDFWTGACTGSGGCVVTMNANKSVTAVFAAIDPSTSADLSVTQSASVSPAFTGKDVVYTITVANAGPLAATDVVLTDLLPAGTTFIWAHPGCTHAAGTVTCPIGSLASGASAQRKVVARPTVASSITNTATVAGAQPDANPANNAVNSILSVNASPAGVAVQRYRLFSPVTNEHLYTTDLNEYNVLGSFVGTWIQEGTIGKVLDNPGSFNGVAATPYYRLYNTSNAQHHWTTDANEYYTLILFPQYNSEGVDGYIFPTQAAGTIPLYRLLYPFSVPVEGLHHWTIDVNEYNALIASFGWIGEGGSGFVIP